jgi:hypothetical protein
MLNRRLSEYLFYGSLALIALVIFIIRTVVVGSLDTRIEETDRENISLRAQIETLEETVQDNKNIQTSSLYELYDIIPNVYSGTELTYKTVALLESLGINESNDIQRTVFVDHNITFNEDSMFRDISREYKIVEVQVYFTTQDADIVTQFIDALYANEQLFIVRNLDYNVPDNDDFISVSINFLAIYDVEETEES